MSFDILGPLAALRNQLADEDQRRQELADFERRRMEQRSYEEQQDRLNLKRQMLGNLYGVVDDNTLASFGSDLPSGEMQMHRKLNQVVAKKIKEEQERAEVSQSGPQLAAALPEILRFPVEKRTPEQEAAVNRAAETLQTRPDLGALAQTGAEFGKLRAAGLDVESLAAARRARAERSAAVIGALGRTDLAGAVKDYGEQLTNRLSGAMLIGDPAQQAAAIGEIDADIKSQIDRAYVTAPDLGNAIYERVLSKAKGEFYAAEFSHMRGMTQRAAISDSLMADEQMPRDVANVRAQEIQNDVKESRVAREAVSGLWMVYPSAKSATEAQQANGPLVSTIARTQALSTAIGKKYRGDLTRLTAQINLWKEAIGEAGEAPDPKDKEATALWQADVESRAVDKGVDPLFMELHTNLQNQTLAEVYAVARSTFTDRIVDYVQSMMPKLRSLRASDDGTLYGPFSARLSATIENARTRSIGFAPTDRLDRVGRAWDYGYRQRVDSETRRLHQRYTPEVFSSDSSKAMENASKVWQFLDQAAAGRGTP